MYCISITSFAQIEVFNQTDFAAEKYIDINHERMLITKFNPSAAMPLFSITNSRILELQEMMRWKAQDGDVLRIYIQNKNYAWDLTEAQRKTYIKQLEDLKLAGISPQNEVYQDVVRKLETFKQIGVDEFNLNPQNQLVYDFKKGVHTEEHIETFLKKHQNLKRLIVKAEIYTTKKPSLHERVSTLLRSKAGGLLVAGSFFLTAQEMLGNTYKYFVGEENSTDRSNSKLEINRQPSTKSSSSQANRK